MSETKPDVQQPKQEDQPKSVSIGVPVGGVGVKDPRLAPQPAKPFYKTIN